MKNYKNLNEGKRATRAQLLAGAGTAVLATLAISPAGAQGYYGAHTSVGSNWADASISGALSTNALLTNQSRVEAAVRENIAAGGADGQSDSTSTVSANVAAARASANVATATVNQTDAMDAPEGGIAALSVTENAATITSAVEHNGMAVITDGADGSQLTNSGNKISSDTVVNRSVTGVQSVATSDRDYYMRAGSSATLSDGRSADYLQANGSVVVSSMQRNSAVGSSAAAVENRINLVVGGDLAGSAPQLDSNTISATYAGNSASNTAALTAGGTPAFGGSVVVTNAQGNGAAFSDTNGPIIDTDGPFISTPFTNTTNADTLLGARNIDSTISADLGYGDDEGFTGQGYTGEVTGSALTVSNNAITSATTGNEAVGTTPGAAGNRITIGDGVSFEGYGDYGAGSSAGNYNQFGAPNQANANANADLVVVNAQRNANTGTMTASTIGGDIYGDARSLRDGSVAVAGNTIAAAANGNVATGAVQSAAGDGATHISGSVALASDQTNVNAGNLAESRYNDTYAEAGSYYDYDDYYDEFGGVRNATVGLTGNTDRAAAYGNNSTQDIALRASDLPLTGQTLTMFGGEGSGLGLSGGATISTSQSNIGSATTAIVDSSYMGAGVYSDSADQSSIVASGNTQEALAIGNSAASGIALTGTTVGAGAGLMSRQLNDFNSATAASLSGTVEVEADDVSGSKVALTDNLQRAIAYGNTAANSIGVTANQVDLFSDYGNSGSGVAFGAFNEQTQNANVSATAAGEYGSALRLDIDSDVREGSSAINQGNTLVAAAYGNQASTNAALNVGTIDQSDNIYYGSSTVAALNSNQYSSGAVEARVGGSDVVSTYLEDDLRNSSVVIADNSVQALAVGNRANSNSLSVTGTDIATSRNYDMSGAGFAVSNSQDLYGSVTATQQGKESAASIGAYIDDEIDNASVSLTGNAQATQATGSAAVNQLAVSANSLSTSGVLMNSQSASAAVRASAGGPGIGTEPFQFDGSVEAGRNEGGVQLMLGSGEIDGSTVQIAGNTATSGAVVNNATNSVSASATQLSGATERYYNRPSIDPMAQPSMVLANNQSASGGSSATAEIFGANRIDSDGSADIEDSTIDISGNSQAANALVNVAANSITLSGTNISGFDGGNAAGASLASDQRADGVPVSSMSDLQLATPAASYDSTISIANNSNTALGVINDVTNSVVVKATNVESDTYYVNGNAGLSGADLSADHALNTTQYASGSVVSNATTHIANSDVSKYEYDYDYENNRSLSDGSVSVTGNVTTAEASANRALNSATVTGSAGQSASAGIANTQESSANVAAKAASTAQLELSGYNDRPTFSILNDEGYSSPALNSGSVVVQGNSTTALARGNSAANALTVASSRGDSYGSNSSVNGNSASASAPAMVLNSQSNGGAVSADATGLHGTALNGGYGQPAMTASTATVSGNSVAAAAYGNSATNSLNATALNGSGSGGAVANYQLNTGAVRASAVSVTFGGTIPNSGMSGAALGVTGNQVTATAIGNSVVSTLTSGR